MFAQTDVGRTREHNEDTFLVANLEGGAELLFEQEPLDVPVDTHGLLFVVADGMGGAASGEIASGMAGEAVLSVLRERWTDRPAPRVADFAAALRDATVMANSRIHAFSREHPEHRGMGTTATVAGVFGDSVYVAQVGDSRAYLLRDGVARPLTKDQSLMQRLVEAGELTEEQAESSERRNIILQALGPEAQVTIDLTVQKLRRGDTLIMCSDGLCGLVRAPEIARVASEAPDVRSICERLIARANELGGPDNITVIAATFNGQTLMDARADEAFGYLAYPLAGTLNPDAAELPTPASAPRGHLRSDPTPRYGTPAPSADVIEAEFARARSESAATRAKSGETTPSASQPFSDDAAVALGAPVSVVQERRRKVEPIYFALTAIAVIAAIWFGLGVLRG